MHSYNLKELEQLLSLPAATLRSLIRAGHVAPRKTGTRYAFSFQELRVLRMAGALHAAKIPARKINVALKKLRLELARDVPLSQLSIGAVGDQITVRDGGARWETDSGQYTLALDASVVAGAITALPTSQAGPHDTAAGQFETALALDVAGSADAVEAYKRCLATDPGHLEARINLGRLLHERGALREAERLYAEASANDPLLSFNLGVVLEDSAQEPLAIDAYRQALALDPGFADAHFNLARLHEKAGNLRDATRHLLAYRRCLDKIGI